MRADARDAQMPRVSVLMTVYNGASYLREAIDSVVHQTFPDWELIIIENGSTDASPDIVRSYHDARIRVDWLPHNVGRTPALRRAFDLARGEYIAVLDADDVAEPERLAAEARYLDEHADVTLVGTWATRIDERGEVLETYDPPGDPDEVVQAFGWTNPIIHSAAMFRAHDARAVGGYPEELPYAQDNGLWVRLASAGRVAIIPARLCRHRLVRQSMTRSRELQLQLAQDKFWVLSEARRHLPLDRGARRRNREELAIAECQYVVALAGRRRAGDAGKALARAMLRNPRGILWNRVVRSWFGGRALHR